MCAPQLFPKTFFPGGPKVCSPLLPRIRARAAGAAPSAGAMLFLRCLVALGPLAHQDPFMAPSLLVLSDDQKQLWRSARKGDVQVLRDLLSNERAKVNVLDPESGFAALHLSSGHGELPAVQLLLEYGARINMETREGITPLQCAAGPGHLHVVRYLSSVGAALDVQARSRHPALRVPRCPRLCRVPFRQIRPFPPLAPSRSACTASAR